MLWIYIDTSNIDYINYYFIWKILLKRYKKLKISFVFNTLIKRNDQL